MKDVGAPFGEKLDERGVQFSPWVNRSVSFRVEFQLPLESNSLVGGNLTRLNFRLAK